MNIIGSLSVAAATAHMHSANRPLPRQPGLGLFPIGLGLALPYDAGKRKRLKRGGGTKKVLGIVGGIAAGAAAIGGAAYGYNVIGQFDRQSPVQQMAQISSAFHKFDVKPGGFLHGIMTRYRGK